MKKLSFFATILFVSLLLNSTAQNCGYYIPLKKGTGLEMQSFNAGGKSSGSYKQTIQNVTNDGTFDIAQIHSENFDAKGKSVGMQDFNMKCNGSTVIIDAKSLLDPKTMDGYKDMQVEMEAVDIEIPSNIAVGNTLKDSEIKVTVTNQGMNFANITMKLTNRKIASQEKITVPAGEYTCYKLTYDILFEMKTMGFPMTMKMKGTDFYSSAVGAVRTEQYDEKGKMLGYSVLAKIF